MAAFLPAALTAAGSIAGGFLSGRSSQPKESKTEKTRRHFLDKLIASLDGSGPFSDLYSADEATFQKSFVEPAKQRFASQIAPGIQQKYAASGMKQSSAMEDQLLRAGVDLDQMLNQQYYNFQQDAMNRRQGGINQVLGFSGGTPAGTSGWQDFGQAVSGYASGPQFGKDIDAILQGMQKPAANQTYNPNIPPPRPGYKQDFRDISFLQR